MTFLSGLLKWLVVLLVLANLAVAAGWLARSQLREQGVLPPVPPGRLEVGRQELSPATGATPAEVLAAGLEAVADPDAPAAQSPPRLPAKVAAEAPAAAAPANAGPVCAVVGPFADRAAAQEARLAIERAGGTAKLQTEQAADYLVFVPPASTTEAAAKTRLALRRHGLDAYVIPSGERRNGVSVGVFRDRGLAAAQQRRATEAGHPAQMAARDRAATYRLLARAPAAALAGLPQAACRGLTDDTPDRP